MNAPPASQPFDPASIPWIPLGPGESFKPLHFSDRGRALLLRLEPGAIVPLHRHFGEVHAFNLSGYRKLIEASFRSERWSTSARMAR